MTVAIMQPYFLPYLGYISLIKHTDRFILFDTVQFIRHGWIERNRVLKQNGGWLYIQVPLVKSPRETLIKDIVIDNTSDWKSKILAQLQPYKKIAPYYYKVIELLKRVFASEYTSIVKLNQALLTALCEYLDFPRSFEIFSEMELDIDTPNAPDEWALNICKKMDGEITYINPIGGLDFFDREKYKNNNIQLFFQKMNLMPYDQKREINELGLSIIDVMMFNSVEAINEMLDNFELI